MSIAKIISRTALKLNPLVTSWDELGTPLRIEFDDKSVAQTDEIEELCPEKRTAARATIRAFQCHTFSCSAARHQLECGKRTLIMGIINVTPDSFSDGGKHFDISNAVEHGLAMVKAGAHILDIGGESTRPGAEPVPVDEECRRVVPVIAALAKQCEVPISVDTSKPAVAEAAIGAGAVIVNDVTALHAPGMATLIARNNAGCVLMHMLGDPRTMQENPVYGDVVREVAGFLRHAVSRAVASGIALDHIIIDPGIGFGKTPAHNIELIRRLPVFASLGLPVLVGVSRKSFIGRTLGLPIERRLNASLAANILSIAGRASIIRVHDVSEAAETAAMADAIIHRP